MTNLKSFQKTIQNRKTVNNVRKSPGRETDSEDSRERNATVSRPRQTLLNSTKQSLTMKILYLKTRNIWINAAMAYPLNRTVVLKFRIIIIITKSSKPPRLSSEQIASEEVKVIWTCPRVSSIRVSVSPRTQEIESATQSSKANLGRQTN